MSWQTLDPHIRTTAEHVLTPKQLDIFKLHLAGLGTRRISTMLGTSRTSIRDHLDATHANLEQAGIHRDAHRRYYTKDAA